MRKISVVLVLSLICFFCVNMSSYATSFSNDIVVGDDCDGGSCPLPPDGDDGDDQGGCDGGSCPLPDDKLVCGDGDDSCPLPPDGDDGDDQDPDCGGCSGDKLTGDDCDGGSCPLPPDGDDGDDQGGCNDGGCHGDK